MPFNINAQVILGGPKNINKVRNSIKSKLSNITVAVKASISKSGANLLSGFNKQVNSLNAGQKTLNNNTKKTAKSFNSLATATGKINASNNRLITSTKQVNKNLNTTEKQIKSTANEMVAFGKDSALAIRRFAAFTIATGAVFGFVRAVQAGVTEAIKFQRELVRVIQVTGATSKELNGLKKTVDDLSTSLGLDANKLIEVSRIFAQTGQSIDQVKDSIKAVARASLAPTFGSIESTTEGAIAALSQFGIAANKTEGVLGSLNAVSKKFAVESGDLISAIRRAGGVFAASTAQLGKPEERLRELISIFTSVRATTRESADSIATGLRTIFTRIQRPQTIKFLEQFGIQLRATAEDAKKLGIAQGDFVGIFEAFRKISGEIDSLDTLGLAKVVEELGGIRQVGKLLPALRGFTKAEEARRVAMEGTNSISKDVKIATQSLAVQIEQTREKFQKFIRDIASSDTFQNLAKFALGTANAFITLADALRPALPLITAIAAVKLTGAAFDFGRGFTGGIRKQGGGGNGVGGSGLTSLLLGDKLGSAASGASGSAKKAAQKQTQSAVSNNSQTVNANTSALKTLNQTYLQLRTANASLLTATQNVATSNANVVSAIGRLPSLIGAGAGLNVRSPIKFKKKGLRSGGSIPKFAQGGEVSGPSHAQGGVLAELEGGERVLSKKQNKKFAGGGTIRRGPNFDPKFPGGVFGLSSPGSVAGFFLRADDKEPGSGQIANFTTLNSKADQFKTPNGLLGKIIEKQDIIGAGPYSSKNELLKNTQLNDIITDSVIKGLKKSVRESTTGLLRIDKGGSGFTLNRSRIKKAGDQLISTISSSSQDSKSDSAGATSTMAGFVFEGLIGAISGAKISGGKGGFDFPNFTDGNKDELSTFFNVKRSTLTPVQVADAKRTASRSTGKRKVREKIASSVRDSFSPVGTDQYPAFIKQIKEAKLVDGETQSTVSNRTPRRRGAATGGSISGVDVAISKGELIVPPNEANRNLGALTRANQGFFAGNLLNNLPNSIIAQGPGTGTSDSIRTSLPQGSFVVNARDTSRLGSANKLASGGRVSFKGGGGVRQGFAGGGSISSILEGGTKIAAVAAVISGLDFSSFDKFQSSIISSALSLAFLGNLFNQGGKDVAKVAEAAKETAKSISKLGDKSKKQTKPDPRIDKFKAKSELDLEKSRQRIRNRKAGLTVDERRARASARIGQPIFGPKERILERDRIAKKLSSQRKPSLKNILGITQGRDPLDISAERVRSKKFKSQSPFFIGPPRPVTKAERIARSGGRSGFNAEDISQLQTSRARVRSNKSKSDAERIARIDRRSEAQLERSRSRIRLNRTKEGANFIGPPSRLLTSRERIARAAGRKGFGGRRNLSNLLGAGAGDISKLAKGTSSFLGSTAGRLGLGGAAVLAAPVIDAIATGLIGKRTKIGDSSGFTASQGGLQSAQLLGGIKGVVTGASTGALIGSFIPIVGPIIGGIGGAVIGGITGVFAAAKSQLQFEEFAKLQQSSNRLNFALDMLDKKGTSSALALSLVAKTSKDLVSTILSSSDNIARVNVSGGSENLGGGIFNSIGSVSRTIGTGANLGEKISLGIAEILGAGFFGIGASSRELTRAKGVADISNNVESFDKSLKAIPDEVFKKASDQFVKLSTEISNAIPIEEISAITALGADASFNDITLALQNASGSSDIFKQKLKTLIAVQGFQIAGNIKKTNAGFDALAGESTKDKQFFNIGKEANKAFLSSFQQTGSFEKAKEASDKAFNKAIASTQNFGSRETIEVLRKRVKRDQAGGIEFNTGIETASRKFGVSKNQLIQLISRTDEFTLSQDKQSAALILNITKQRELEHALLSQVRGIDALAAALDGLQGGMDSVTNDFITSATNIQAEVSRILSIDQNISASARSNVFANKGKGRSIEELQGGVSRISGDQSFSDFADIIGFSNSLDQALKDVVFDVEKSGKNLTFVEIQDLLLDKLGKSFTDLTSPVKTQFLESFEAIFTGARQSGARLSKEGIIDGLGQLGGTQEKLSALGVKTAETMESLTNNVNKLDAAIVNSINLGIQNERQRTGGNLKSLNKGFDLEDRLNKFTNVNPDEFAETRKRLERRTGVLLNQGAGSGVALPKNVLDPSALLKRRGDLEAQRSKQQKELDAIGNKALEPVKVDILSKQLEKTTSALEGTKKAIELQTDETASLGAIESKLSSIQAQRLSGRQRLQAALSQLAGAKTPEAQARILNDLIRPLVAASKVQSGQSITFQEGAALGAGLGEGVTGALARFLGLQDRPDLIEKSLANFQLGGLDAFAKILGKSVADAFFGGPATTVKGGTKEEKSGLEQLKAIIKSQQELIGGSVKINSDLIINQQLDFRKAIDKTGVSIEGLIKQLARLRSEIVAESNKNIPNTGPLFSHNDTITQSELFGIEPDKLKHGGVIKGPSHAQGGVLVEVEGGERIISKKDMRDMPSFRDGTGSGLDSSGLQKIDDFFSGGKNSFSFNRQNTELIKRLTDQSPDARTARIEARKAKTDSFYTRIKKHRDRDRKLYESFNPEGRSRALGNQVASMNKEIGPAPSAFMSKRNEGATGYAGQRTAADVLGITEEQVLRGETGGVRPPSYGPEQSFDNKKPDFKLNRSKISRRLGPNNKSDLEFERLKRRTNQLSGRTLPGEAPGDLFVDENLAPGEDFDFNGQTTGYKSFQRFLAEDAKKQAASVAAFNKQAQKAVPKINTGPNTEGPFGIDKQAHESRMKLKEQAAINKSIKDRSRSGDTIDTKPFKTGKAMSIAETTQKLRPQSENDIFFAKVREKQAARKAKREAGGGFLDNAPNAMRGDLSKRDKDGNYIGSSSFLDNAPNAMRGDLSKRDKDGNYIGSSSFLDNAPNAMRGSGLKDKYVGKQPRPSDPDYYFSKKNPQPRKSGQPRDQKYDPFYNKPRNDGEDRKPKGRGRPGFTDTDGNRIPKGQRRPNAAPMFDEDGKRIPRGVRLQQERQNSLNGLSPTASKTISGPSGLPGGIFNVKDSLKSNTSGGKGQSGPTFQTMEFRQNRTDGTNTADGRSGPMLQTLPERVNRTDGTNTARPGPHLQELIGNRARNEMQNPQSGQAGNQASQLEAMKRFETSLNTFATTISSSKFSSDLLMAADKLAQLPVIQLSLNTTVAPVEVILNGASIMAQFGPDVQGKIMVAINDEFNKRFGAVGELKDQSFQV